MFFGRKKDKASHLQEALATILTHLQEIQTSNRAYQQGVLEVLLATLQRIESKVDAVCQKSCEAGDLLAALQQIESKVDAVSQKLREEPLLVKGSYVSPILQEAQKMARDNDVAVEIDADMTVLINALQQFGFTVDRVGSPFLRTDWLNKLAAYIGEHWELFRKIWKEFKHALQGSGSMKKSLSFYEAVERSHICTLCSRLQEFALLSSYSYSAKSSTLQAKVQTTSRAQAFISGIWFERFLLTEIKAALNQHNTIHKMSKSLRVLNDTVVRLPDQTYAELDLFCEVDGFYFWLEAKTGDYQQDIGKYVQRAQLMNLSAKQAMLVVLDLSETICHALSSSYPNITVLNQQMVRPAIRELLKEAFVSSQTTSSQEV